MPIDRLTYLRQLGYTGTLAQMEIQLTNNTTGNTETKVAPSSAAGGAGLTVPPGVAPSKPRDGDIWTTSSGLFVRINGVTKTVTLT